MLSRILGRVINDQRRRSQAYKRGGEGTARSAGNGAGAERDDPFTRTYADLDALLSPLPPVEDLIIANSELEFLLGRVRDPILIRLIKLRYEGFTRKAIAEDLSVTERTIQQRLVVIRKIFTDYNLNGHG